MPGDRALRGRLVDHRMSQDTTLAASRSPGRASLDDPSPCCSDCSKGQGIQESVGTAMQDDTDSVDGVDLDSGVLEPDESLDDTQVGDVLDEGYSPPERSWEIEGWGFTAREASGHESLDGRLARELPDVAADDGDDLGDSTDTDGELYDTEVGRGRSGRLAEYEGTFDELQLLVAVDVGIDGGAASAEEAAVHVVADDADDLAEPTD